MVFCPKCGTGNKDNAEFCKNCGYSLKSSDKGFIAKLNEKLNILAVFIGLVISLLLLVLSPFFYGLVTSGTLSIIGFIYLILLSMMFIGGFIASVIGCRTYSEGMVNGGFLGLVSIVNLGFVVGILSIIAVTIMSAISSALSSFGGSSSSTTSNPVSSATSALPMVELMLLPFLMLLLAVAGGWFGVFIKKLLE